MTALAVRRATDGSVAWRSVVHTVQARPADHQVFYGLAAELVDTLSTLASLARLLTGQVARYPETVSAAGARLYDDSRSGPVPVDPRQRLAAAVVELDQLAAATWDATGAANAFWSSISHIGTEPGTEPASGQDST